MVGEEAKGEVLDDLCLLLGYGVRSSHAHILYATYTAWWEVEGSADLDGEFECLDVAALQHHLITMPIKQFTLVTELAYHVCVLEAEVEGQPCPPTGQEWLRTFAFLLAYDVRGPFANPTIHGTKVPPPPPPHRQPTTITSRSPTPPTPAPTTASRTL